VARKPNLKAELQEAEKGIIDSYNRYKELFFKGCSDPSYCDGTNINLVCNHINYYKRRIEELAQGMFWLYPDCYYWPEPRKVDDKYMAVTRRIPCRGEVHEATPKPFNVAW
jgi:hypothetical protein